MEWLVRLAHLVIWPNSQTHKLTPHLYSLNSDASSSSFFWYCKMLIFLGSHVTCLEITTLENINRGRCLRSLRIHVHKRIFTFFVMLLKFYKIYTCTELASLDILKKKCDFWVYLATLTIYCRLHQSPNLCVWKQEVTCWVIVARQLYISQTDMNFKHQKNGPSWQLVDRLFTLILCPSHSSFHRMTHLGSLICSSFINNLTHLA